MKRAHTEHSLALQAVRFARNAIQEVSQLRLVPTNARLELAACLDALARCEIKLRDSLAGLSEIREMPFKAPLDTAGDDS